MNISNQIKFLGAFLLMPILIFDFFKFLIFKKNISETSYQIFVRLFCLTGGLSNSLINYFLKEKKISIPKDCEKKKLFTKNNLEEINKQIISNGYFYFPEFIDTLKINKIKTFLNKTPGRYSSDTYNTKKNEYEFFDEKSPKAVKFSYNFNEIIKNEEIQNLAFNPTLINIAQNYLGSAPILDIIGAWWSTSGLSNKPDINSAQLWHFDLDRPKWIKVFFYLTDCDEFTGPHSFISGTHVNNGIPLSLRIHGYKRLDDELIDKYFDTSKIKSFTGKSGTMVLEDTRGLHKGQFLKKGARLILQFQYSSSLFGSGIEQIKMPEKLFENARLFKSVAPKIFDNFY
jgi:hypothetical protein